MNPSYIPHTFPPIPPSCSSIPLQDHQIKSAVNISVHQLNEQFYQDKFRGMGNYGNK